MKSWVFSYLRCPKCMSSLESITFEANEQGKVVEGILICCNLNCQAWYPIVRGIPRMLPVSLRVKMTEQFIYEHRVALLSIGLINQCRRNYADELRELKQHIIQKFGFEWLEYARFGWDDPFYNIQHEESEFRFKSLLVPEDIHGKLVLDAGSGNGRYTYWAAQYGGQVIGMDLGDGVESASQNTADLPNVSIVQGDIFNLPFENGCFDIIFSIGVLMLTGNARKATSSLAGKLKPGGSLTVHVYGKGNPIYEFVDFTIRNKTTRMSISDLQEFTRRAYALRRMFERIRLANMVSLFVRLDSHPHCIFDWYAAPIATHHTYDEVKKWITDLGLRIVETNEAPVTPKSSIKRLLRPILRVPTSVTVRGVAQ